MNAQPQIRSCLKPDIKLTVIPKRGRGCFRLGDTSASAVEGGQLWPIECHPGSFPAWRNQGPFLIR